MTRKRMDSHRWDSSLDPDLVPLFLGLQWAQSRSLATMRPLLGRRGMSMAEFDLLATLRNAPLPHELTPSQIREEMVITSGGLTKVMLQLEARGLVERLQLPGDLRVKPIRLTPAGRQAIESAMTETLAVTGAWVRNALDIVEIGQLTRLLGKLIDTPVG